MLLCIQRGCLLQGVRKGFVVWPPSVCMCVIRVASAPPKAMRKDSVCANGPQRKVCQSKIRESSMCKDGECWLRCSSRAVWMAAFSYSPFSLLIHKAAWARAQLEQLFLYNNHPLLSVCLLLFGTLVYNAHPFLLKSLPPSPPFVSPLPLSISSSFQFY